MVSWGGEPVYLSRIVFSFHKGEIPKGLLVRHTCDIKECVQPTHLILGTTGDNIHDSFRRQGRLIKIPQTAVDSLRSGQLSIADACRLYKIKVKHAYAIRAGWKRIIRWS